MRANEWEYDEEYDGWDSISDEEYDDLLVGLTAGIIILIFTFTLMKVLGI